MDYPNVTIDSEGAYVFNLHTKEEVLSWGPASRSNPTRVVRRLLSGQKKEGDETGDDSKFYAALACVSVFAESAFDKQRGCTPNQVQVIWAGLVEAGVVEALCKNVLEMTQTLHLCPGLPEEKREEARLNVSEGLDDLLERMH